MSRGILLAILIALALLGIADSVYLAESATLGNPLVCDIGAGLDGCNIVAQSPYSKFFGIPLAYFGVVFYVLLLLGSVAVIAYPRRLMYKVLLGISVIGVIASAIFLFIQFGLIKALCIYCLASALFAFLALPIAIRLLTRHAPALPVVVP